MEIVGSFFDEEWDSLSKMLDNPDFLLHFDGSSLFSTNGEIPSAHFLPTSENAFLSSDNHTFDPNFCCVSQESSNTSEIDKALFPDSTFESMNFYNMDSNNDSLMVPVFSDDVMEEILHLKGQWGNAETRPAENGDHCDEMQLKRKYAAPGMQSQDKDKSENYPPGGPKKKPRFSRNAQKNRMAVQSKKNKKTIQDNNNEEEISNAGGNRQSSSSCTSEDDSNASQELNGGSTSESKGSPCLNSNGKTRASRGSATDPQSIYARRRRERINERLRILQNLVPNGTKVDISTMLEDAVHYVKFLQLQIKLLSSDDLWMYAPLAYNGMDMGIYEKISPNLRTQN